MEVDAVVTSQTCNQADRCYEILERIFENIFAIENSE